MKNSIKTLFAIATLTAVICLGLLTAQSEQEKQPLLKPAYQLVISDTFEGYQYKPIHGTTVIFYLEKVTNEAGKPEWRIQQIAGPWGNSGGLVDPKIQFKKEFSNEFLITFQEATRVSLWRSGLTPNFEWNGRTIDVRDHISKQPQTYNK